MKKNTKTKTSKKEMSEGKAIAIAVLLFGAGLFIALYLLQLIFNYFFPNF